ncbi:MAG: hypothetical protein GY927_05675 [bacterium]|nr:hypothetical protein [bacterium]
MSREVSRDIYRYMIMKYHPDQFGNIAFPNEVFAYFLAVILRLNIDYNELLEDFNPLEKRQQADRAWQNLPKIDTLS